MTPKQTLTHLAGYSTLALILGTAEWSAFGWVFALPILIGTLAYAGWLGYQAVLSRAKTAYYRDHPEDHQTTGEVAPDGGSRLDTAGDRNRHDDEDWK